MSHIYVNHVNFEYEESASYHDILVNSGSGAPSIVEEILTVAHIYVNAINLEIPLGAFPTDILTCNQLATHTLLEEISGTPIAPEPEVVQGGGVVSVDDLIYVGLPRRLPEFVGAHAQSYQDILEEILVAEEVTHVSTTSNSLQTKVRRPVYKRTREIEVLPYMLATDKRVYVATPLPESPSKREEEELLLLGII